MKQTAVQFVVNKLEKLTGLNLKDEPIINQALKMEKEQIENAFDYGQFDLGMESKEYYKEIYEAQEN